MGLTYPVLGFNDLVEVLQELGFDVNSDALQRPVPEKVQNMYAGFNEMLLDNSQEDTPAFKAQDQLEYQEELHAKSLPLMNFIGRW